MITKLPRPAMLIALMFLVGTLIAFVLYSDRISGTAVAARSASPDASELPIVISAIDGMSVFRHPSKRDAEAAAFTNRLSPALSADQNDQPVGWRLGHPRLGTSRVLAEGGISTVFGYVTTKNKVCFGIAKFASGCTSGFSEDMPIDFQYGDRAIGDPGLLWGVAPDTVTTIEILDGATTQAVALKDNAFLYIGRGSSSDFRSLVVTSQDGSKKTIPLATAANPLD